MECTAVSIGGVVGLSFIGLCVRNVEGKLGEYIGGELAREIIPVTVTHAEKVPYCFERVIVFF